MKRSTQVLLTLMLPAVAAFGCDSANKQGVAKASNCSGPAKPGEPAKTEFCDPATTRTHTARSGSYFPWIWYWGSGGGSYGSNTGVQAGSASTAGSTTSRPANASGLSAPSRPTGAPSSVKSGGFGGTGGSLSSAS